MVRRWIRTETHVPLWTLHPQASSVCRELVQCGCLKGCNNKCTCLSKTLCCTKLCACVGQCYNPHNEIPLVNPSSNSSISHLCRSKNTRCKCKKGCSKKCGCRRANRVCVVGCGCGGECHQLMQTL